MACLRRALSPTFPAGALVFFIPWRVVAEDSGAAHLDLLGPPGRRCALIFSQSRHERAFSNDAWVSGRLPSQHEPEGYSAAASSFVACFTVLLFEPHTTMPPSNNETAAAMTGSP